ncbi:hypothetical protein [Streptomyces sp. NBC_01803]|uniref:hypothetical protein n=1 Tax=Streptomyces sp. NBC_01803 TaxID=2975946 RepID=UPI002DDA9263|nr:hypothetical protein [Streptomyces sp. NBC_01803]WSA43664.1 hypothetical protein OIE51_05260 [Streptomyces sp. NBC_01803]
MARHAGIRAALKDGGAFAAQSGAGLNPAAGSLLGAVLGADGPHYRAVRQILSHTMLPHRGRGTLQQAMNAYAATVVDRLLETSQELGRRSVSSSPFNPATASYNPPRPRVPDIPL